eukprot:gene8641-biopygen4645
MNPAVINIFLGPPDGRLIGSSLAARPRKVQQHAVSQGENKVGMDGHGAAGAACIPPQIKQRVTRCRRHCVTSRGEVLCGLPWCEQVRRGTSSDLLTPWKSTECSGSELKRNERVGNQGTWENNAEGAGGEWIR